MENETLREIRKSVKSSTERKEEAIREWLNMRSHPKFSHIEVYDVNEHHKAQEERRKYKPANRSTTCDLCGKKGLKYFMIFKNALGQEFVVGSSCAPLVSFGVPEGYYERTLGEFKKTYLKALRYLRSYDNRGLGKYGPVVRWVFKVDRLRKSGGYAVGIRGKPGSVSFFFANGKRAGQRADLEDINLMRFLAEQDYLTEVSYEYGRPYVTAEFTRGDIK